MKRVFTHMPHSYANTLPRISPWILAGIGIVFLCAASVIAIHNIDSERQQMLDSMKNRADILIWALEGGARSMEGGWRGSPVSPRLVEEVSKQPDIAYAAIIDSQGTIVAHSQRDKIHTQMFTPEELAQFGDMAHSDWYMETANTNEKIMHVYKQFTPTMVHLHNKNRGAGMPHGRRGMQYHRQLNTPLNEYYIFIGIDASSFEKDFSEYLWSTLLMTGLSLATGLAGVMLLLLWQNYRLSQQTLQDTQLLATHILESLPLGILVTDSTGTIVMHNDQCTSMLGVPAEKLNNTPIESAGKIDWHTMMLQANKTPIVPEQEKEILREDIKIVPVGISVSRVANRDGMTAAYLFMLRDLREVKKLQKQLRLNERLSALGNLAAGIAHEIRNPLSSIKGYATYLAGKFSPNDPAHETTNLIVEEVERLNRVVLDLLSVAKPIELNCQPTPVVPVISRALRLVLPDTQEKGITLHSPAEDASSELDSYYAQVDEEKLTQALLNLLLNAVQATETGGDISVAIHSEQTSSGQHTVAISIVDTGQGMTPETVANIFTPYFTTKASGTGLGLTITHQIIEQHGGEIKVHSQPGKGTVFTILLPAATPEKEPS